MWTEIPTINKISVDLILVNSCVLQELNDVHETIQSHSMLFDSRVRGTFKNHTRYEGKRSHWMVGGGIKQGVPTYFVQQDNWKKKGWLSFTPPPRPHTDIFLHTDSATPMSMERTKKFACKGFIDLTQK